MVHLGYGKWTKKKNVTPQTLGGRTLKSVEQFPPPFAVYVVHLHYPPQAINISLIAKKRKSVSEKILICCI